MWDFLFWKPIFDVVSQKGITDQMSDIISNIRRLIILCQVVYQMLDMVSNIWYNFGEV